MRNNSERSEGNGGKKALVAALAAGAIGSWVGAEPVARWAVGEPGEAPPVPALEQVQPEPREALKVVIGLDRSGTMKTALPDVRQATLAFLRSNGVLKDGDRIELCQFPDDTDEFGADCNSYVLPGQKAELEAAVAGVAIDPRGARGKTYVNLAVRQMLQRVSGQPNAVVLPWTDAREEEKGDLPTALDGHPPVRIVVPRAEYRTDAQAVAAGLGGDTNVALARSGEEFGQLLDGYAGQLNQKAQAAAQAKADGVNAGNRERHDGLMRAHAGEVARIDAEKRGLEAKIRSVKNWIKGIAATLFILCTGGTIALVKRRNRPRTYGYIVDLSGAYPKTVPLPSSPNKLSLRSVRPTFPEVEMIAEKDGGLSVGGAKLNDGIELGDGLLWFTKSPDQRVLRDLMKQRKKK